MVSAESELNSTFQRLRFARLELNTFKPSWPLSDNSYPGIPKTAGEWFSKQFPDQANTHGAPFLELREQVGEYQSINPLSINIDFFAAVLGGDKRLGHKVIYLESEMQFYYCEPKLKLFKPTSPEKLQNYIRALLVRCAEELSQDVHKLNLFHEWRTDKITKQIVHRAKSILAADHTFFSATSKHVREQGPETYERLTRSFVEMVLEREPGQILPFNHAYLVFLEYLKQKGMPELKRPLFKNVVVPIVKDMFSCALRNDLVGENQKQQQGWKDLRAVGLGSV